MLVEERMTWAQADEYCRDKNAYLAELTQTEERDAVWNYAKGLFFCHCIGRSFFIKSLCQTHSHVLFWGHMCHCFGFLVIYPMSF